MVKYMSTSIPKPPPNRIHDQVPPPNSLTRPGQDDIGHSIPAHFDY